MALFSFLKKKSSKKESTVSEVNSVPATVTAAEKSVSVSIPCKKKKSKDKDEYY